jgi:hypothetical protein
MVKVWKEHRDEGVALFTVCTKLGNDEDIEKWKAFIKEHGFEDAYNVGYGTQVTKSFRDKYDVRATPVKLLLNEDREIIAKRIAPEQIGDYLDHLLQGGEKKQAMETSEPGDLE